MKHALITGITGQDGSYLAELLLDKGYEVYGLMRRKSVVDYGNVDHIKDKIHFIYADMTDQTSLIHAMTISQADEVYNLAAQSFVATSWEQPLATAEIDAIGVTNMLEAIRVVKPEAHFYQASTSEMFGLVQAIPQCETTPFYPRSPYGVAKLYGHWITKNYRESYNLFACSGILFNHESERPRQRIRYQKDHECCCPHQAGRTGLRRARQPGFQARLGTFQRLCSRDVADAAAGYSGRLRYRDERDRTLVNSWITAFACAGIEIEWSGEGVNETGTDKATGKVVVKVNPEFFRPAEVDILLGDPSKAEKTLGWKREIPFQELVSRMVKNDMELVAKEIAFSRL